ncbi:hypothetical protein ACJX0J_008557 [Zea mays]
MYAESSVAANNILYFFFSENLACTKLKSRNSVVDIDLHIAIAGWVYVFHGEVEFDVWIQAFILLEYQYVFSGRHKNFLLVQCPERVYNIYWDPWDMCNALSHYQAQIYFLCFLSLSLYSMLLKVNL